MMNSKREIIGPINLGNNTETPIIEFARKIIDLTGSKSKIIHLPLPQDDPVRRCPDLTLANTKLNWKPKVELEYGLKETVKYFEIT
jgi:UDP-glucuronate decarboxylase